MIKFMMNDKTSFAAYLVQDRSVFYKPCFWEEQWLCEAGRAVIVIPMLQRKRIELVAIISQYKIKVNDNVEAVIKTVICVSF